MMCAAADSDPQAGLLFHHLTVCSQQRGKKKRRERGSMRQKRKKRRRKLEIQAWFNLYSKFVFPGTIGRQ